MYELFIVYRFFLVFSYIFIWNNYKYLHKNKEEKIIFTVEFCL